MQGCQLDPDLFELDLMSPLQFSGSAQAAVICLLMQGDALVPRCHVISTCAVYASLGRCARICMLWFIRTKYRSRDLYSDHVPVHVAEG